MNNTITGIHPLYTPGMNRRTMTCAVEMFGFTVEYIRQGSDTTVRMRAVPFSFTFVCITGMI